MAKLKYRSISRRTVDALDVEKDTVFWDRELAGFGVRVYPSGSKVYVVQTRGPQGPKRVTIGRHGVITASQARRRAAAAIVRIKAGEDPGLSPAPRRKSPTVAEVALRFSASTSKSGASRGLWSTTGRLSTSTSYLRLGVCRSGR